MSTSVFSTTLLEPAILKPVRCGAARASGRPGVCMAQQVGALNLAAGLRDAWLAGSPVVAMTGGSRPERRWRGLYQEAEDFPAFEPYTKWNAAVDAALDGRGLDVSYHRYRAR